MTDFVLMKMQQIGGRTLLFNLKNFVAVPDCEFEMKRPCTSPLDPHQNLDIPKQPKFFYRFLTVKNHLAKKITFNLIFFVSQPCFNRQLALVITKSSSMRVPKIQFNINCNFQLLKPAHCHFAPLFWTKTALKNGNHPGSTFSRPTAMYLSNQWGALSFRSVSVIWKKNLLMLEYDNDWLEFMITKFLNPRVITFFTSSIRAEDRVHA